MYQPAGDHVTAPSGLRSCFVSKTPAIPFLVTVLETLAVDVASIGVGLEKPKNPDRV